MSEHKSVIALTEMQKKLLARKMATMQQDFGLEAIYIRTADGTEMNIGEVVKPQKAVEKGKHTRRRSVNEVGLLTEASLPWLELLCDSEPGETLAIRQEDISQPGIDLQRVVGSMQSLAGKYCGNGAVQVRRVVDPNTKEYYYLVGLGEGLQTQLKKGLQFRVLKLEGKLPRYCQVEEMDFYLGHQGKLQSPQ
jgi:hypothetical protein